MKDNKFINKQKGFTLIELVVVVAIIVVLATIVASNIVVYIKKSGDAKIRASMDSIYTTSTVYFESNGNYASLFANSKILSIMASIQTLSSYSVTTGISADNKTWCACAQLIGISTNANSYCVDSTGFRKENSAYCSGRCNASSCNS